MYFGRAKICCKISFAQSHTLIYVTKYIVNTNSTVNIVLDK